MMKAKTTDPRQEWFEREGGRVEGGLPFCIWRMEHLSTSHVLGSSHGLGTSNVRGTSNVVGKRTHRPMPWDIQRFLYVAMGISTGMGQHGVQMHGTVGTLPCCSLTLALQLDAG